MPNQWSKDANRTWNVARSLWQVILSDRQGENCLGFTNEFELRAKCRFLGRHSRVPGELLEWKSSNAIFLPFFECQVHLNLMDILLFVFNFWTCRVASEVLVPWPGIKPAHPAGEAWSLNHWTNQGSPWISWALCFVSLCLKRSSPDFWVLQP